jgi:flagellar basal-body rod protein FlgC
MAQNPISGVTGIIGSGLLAQDQRMSLIASNMANANSIATPGSQPFRAVEPVFAALPLTDTEDPGAEDMADPTDMGGQPGMGDPPGAASVDVIATMQSNAPAKLVYDPSSPAANQAGYVAESNVSEVQQMVDMIDASQDYEAQVAVLDEHERAESMITQSFIA